MDGQPLRLFDFWISRSTRRFMKSWLFMGCVWTVRCASAQDGSAGTLLVLRPDALEVVRVGVSDYDFGQVRSQYAEQVFRSRDLDGDLALSPSEAIRLPVWDSGTSQLRMLGTDWQSADTAPNDRKLSFSEVLSLIERSFGPSIRIQVDQRGTNRANLLFVLIDRNGDGHLESQELTESPPRLRRSDFDDDEMLTLSELAEVSSVTLPVANSLMSTEPFLWLERGANSAAVIAEIEARYRTPNSPGISLSQLRGINTDADVDSDQFLNTVEIESALKEPKNCCWLKIRPTGSGCGTRWLTTSDDFDVRSFRRGENVKLSGMEFRIQFRSSEQLEKLRIQELNTQFGDADRDNNEYLSKSEYAELVSVAETSVPADPGIVDLNNNQQVTREELLTAGELRALASRCGLQLTVVRESMSLFKLLDFDRNQGISAWEIQTATQRLGALDRNHDGRLSGTELSGELSLEVGFAGTRQESVPMVVARNRNRPVARRASATGPAWFQRMDRNQDQRLSWREFLGTREQFETLDADHDDAISAVEAKP